MHKLLFLLLLTALVVVSGCVSETGDTILEFTDGEPTESGITIPTLNNTEPDANATNVTGELPENITHDLCAGKLCDDSISTCPDGTTVTCENECDPETGNCTSCIPECPEEEPCEITAEGCGECGKFDEEDCSCSIILYCDGNGVCEPSNGEWPDSPDCVGFDGCDDDNDCTQDTFNPNQQVCIHTDICCDDSDDCTVDFFNYTTDECEHSYVCCGDGECQPENGETEESCPKDCLMEEEESGDVVILDLDPEEEIVTLEGYGILMDNWTIEDDSDHVYTFPDSFMIDGMVYLYTLGDPANNTDIYLYWGNQEGGPRNSPIWNNDGDTATLRNDSGDVVYTFSYESS